MKPTLVLNYSWPTGDKNGWEKCLTKSVLARIGDCYYLWKIQVFQASISQMFMVPKTLVAVYWVYATALIMSLWKN